MRLLVDTHCWLWNLLSPERLNPEAQDLLRSHAQRELPIRQHHVLGVEALPAHHRDPFDRILIAQARAEGLTLMTADRLLTLYEIPVL